MRKVPKDKGKFINIGFMGEGYKDEVKSLDFKIEKDGETLKFVTDYVQPDYRCRWGRWIKEVDYVGV